FRDPKNFRIGISNQSGHRARMKIATIIARVLLGLIFVVFGSNAFLYFIPMGPPPQGLAGEYLHAFVAGREAERRLLLAWSAPFSTRLSAIPLITHDES